MPVNDHEAMGGLVSDVIRGIRSGSVETFRACVRGESREDGEESLSRPLVSGIRRVNAPMRPRYSLRQVGNLESSEDDEDTFMASLGSSNFPGEETSEDEARSLPEKDTLQAHDSYFVEQNTFSDCQIAQLNESLPLGGMPSVGGTPDNVATSSDFLIDVEYPQDQPELEEPGLDDDKAKAPEPKEIDVTDAWCRDDWFRVLAENSWQGAAFARGSGEIDSVLAESMHIDRLFLPVREDGVFKEGVRKKGTARYVYLHPRDMMSHAYLKTHPEGILHVLPGWDHRTFINDISYRSRSGPVYRAPIPFLDGELCEIRGFDCKVAMVCPFMSERCRKKNHCDVDPEDDMVLANTKTEDVEEIARKKVRSIYQGLMERQEGRRGLFCGAPIPDPSNQLTVLACRGKPKLVRCSRPYKKSDITLSDSHQARCDYFVGCSGYHPDHKTHNVRHYTRRLDIDNEMVSYLRKLLDGEESVSDPEDSCTFVREKNEHTEKCPRHKVTLVEVECLHRTEDGQERKQRMVTFEPVSMKGLPVERKLLYVMCIGVHTHPPPPPPQATVRKLELIESVQEQSGITGVGQLLKEVQKILIEARDSKRLFDGSIAIPRGLVVKGLKRVKPPVCVMATEIGSLAVLAANTDMPYVRDSKMVGDGYVYFLGLDELLLHASTARSFAGDATFKTVTDKNRSIRVGRWYLYNIVAHASNNRTNGKGVVVMRALMTGLTAPYYYAIWKYFFESLIRASNAVKGNACLEYGNITVPYLPFAQNLHKRSCPVTSITIDFDYAELIGCAEALTAVCGGTTDCHVKGMFIGCEVHLARDLLRRARCEERQRNSKKSSLELLKAYNAFVYAPSPEIAQRELKKIKSFDNDWVAWVERQKMGPLISTCLPNMTPSNRTIGFSSTNVVESHNRRGNQLVGTHLTPSKAAEGLSGLDKVDSELLRTGSFDYIIAARGRRNRSDSILRPVPSGGSFAKKHAKRGGGPARKKSRTSSIPKRKEAESDRNESKKPPMEENVAKDCDFAAISERFRIGVAVLTKRMGQDNANESVSDARRIARMDTLVDIMTGVHTAASMDKIEQVKTAILNGMRSNRDDIEFREALLELFVSCVGGQSAGNGNDGVLSDSIQRGTEGGLDRSMRNIEDSNASNDVNNPALTEK